MTDPNEARRRQQEAARMRASRGAHPSGGFPSDGTIADVLGWVDNNTARAETALEQERRKPHPRATLERKLVDMIMAAG